MLGRAHTVAAIALMAFVPLAPLGLWIYAKTASVDRGATIARNQQVFRSVRPAGGATLYGQHSYAEYRWGADGASLVPIDRYRTEFFLRLPKPMRPDAIVAYYVRALRGWHADLQAVDCATLGLKAGCGAAAAVFTHAGATVDVDVAESLRHAQHATEYAVYVSQ